MAESDHIDDIALFFEQNKKPVARWVSHDVYADPRYRLGSAEKWRDIVVAFASSDESSEPVFVANLSNLNEPGGDPDDVSSANEDVLRSSSRPSPAEEEAVETEVSDGDLLVIPWSDPDNVYLVPKSRYENPDECPEITGNNSYDLKFMALTEGVVLANVPKTDLAGMSCYLLNLHALRRPGSRAKEVARVRGRSRLSR